MTRITTIANQKGGIGKSTTAAALGAGLATRGYKVLFIDLDAQGNLSYTLRADASGINSPGAYDALTRVCTTKEAIQHTALGDVMASSPALIGADTAITAVGKEYRLQEALGQLDGQYTHIIIDTPPSLGICTVNALAAASDVVIPAQADVFSLQGVGQLWQTIQAVKRYCNQRIRIDGLLLTRYNARAAITREVAAMFNQTAEQIGTKVYNARIRECSAIKEAVAVGKDIYSYAPRSNAVIDYSAFIDEYMTGGYNNG